MSGRAVEALNQPGECRECGGSSLSWFADRQNNSGVQDGRLRMHDVRGIFVLGCDDCSATLAVVSADKIADHLNTRAQLPNPQAAPKPELAVWYGPMPESNGKSNFTALLHRKGESLLRGTTITIDRSEYPDRVRYEADRVRYLLGELDVKPCILDYDTDLHSGYTPPGESQ